MTLDSRLLSLLVCPLCKGPLLLQGDKSAGGHAELCCLADRLAFPIRDGIPVMLEADARSLDDEEVDRLRPAHPPGGAR
jgi:uncharacterized protein